MGKFLREQYEYEWLFSYAEFAYLSSSSCVHIYEWKTQNIQPLEIFPPCWDNICLHSNVTPYTLIHHFYRGKFTLLQTRRGYQEAGGSLCPIVWIMEG